MASEKSPAFQFYPKDFLSDLNVQAMTMAERGMYITLLCLAWMNHALPTDLTRLARLCHLPMSVFRRLWPAVAPCFQMQGNVYVQPRIEREREKQLTYRALKAAAGQKGGKSRAQALAQAKQRLSSETSKSLAKPSPPSPSSSSSIDLNTLALPKPAPPTTEFLTWFQAEYKTRRDGATYCVVWAKHGAIVKRLLRTHALERLKKHAVLLLSSTVDEWIDDSDRGIEVLAAKINWLEERLASWEKQHEA